MKKSTKSLLKAALVTSVVGSGFCIAGLCLGFTFGEFGAAVEAGNFQLIGPSDLQDKFSTVVTDTVYEGMEYEQSFAKEVKALELDLGVGDCYLCIYDGNEWKVSGTNLPASFQCRMDGSTLEIDCESSSWRFWEKSSDSVLTLYIPEDHLLKKVDIDSGVGNIQTENGTLICEELDLDCGVGDCYLDLDILEKADLDGGVGDIYLTLKDSMNTYNFDVDCGVGEITIGTIHISELGGTQKIDYGADREIVVDSGVGNVQILFE